MRAEPPVPAGVLAAIRAPFLETGDLLTSLSFQRRRVLRVAARPYEGRIKRRHTPCGIRPKRISGGLC